MRIFPGGMTAEPDDFVDPHEAQPDISEDAPNQQVRDDDFQAVTGTTLTRSKPMRSMRRVQDV